MAKCKLVRANRRLVKAVVSGYQKIERGVVRGFNKLCDFFVDQFLTRDGESVEEARARLSSKDQ